MFVGDTRQSEASLLEIRNSPVRTVPSEGIYSISGAHSPGLPSGPVSEPLSGIIRTGWKENGCRQIGLCVTVCVREKWKIDFLPDVRSGSGWKVVQSLDNL